MESRVSHFLLFPGPTKANVPTDFQGRKHRKPLWNCLKSSQNKSRPHIPHRSEGLPCYVATLLLKTFSRRTWNDRIWCSMELTTKNAKESAKVQRARSVDFQFFSTGVHCTERKANWKMTNIFKNNYIYKILNP